MTASARPVDSSTVRSDLLAGAATVTAALGLGTLATASSFAIVAGGLFILGAGQSALTTSLVTAAQRALPEWVRGRALSIYLLVFYLSTTVGSAAWGVGAARLGVQLSLAVAALALLGSLVLASRLRLKDAEELDSASLEWHAMATLVNRPQLQDGPVLVSVTYHVDRANAAAFAEEMRIAGEHRRRDGAMQWGIYRDVDDPETFVETFMAASWAEHLRQRERPTRDDLRAWREAQHLFRIVQVKHFVAPRAWQHARRTRRHHQAAHQPQTSHQMDGSDIESPANSRGGKPEPG